MYMKKQFKNSIDNPILSLFTMKFQLFSSQENEKIMIPKDSHLQKEFSLLNYILFSQFPYILHFYITLFAKFPEWCIELFISAHYMSLIFQINVF